MWGYGRMGVSKRKTRYLGFRSRLDRNSPVAFVHSQARSYADTPIRPSPSLNRQSLLGGSDRVVPIQTGNESGAHFGRANGFAFVMISAIAESKFIHFPDHLESAG